MGRTYDGIDDDLSAWLREQPMWFVGTAPLAADGRVNVSPRGHDTFSVLSPQRVAWVDYTGSGIETAAHLRENGRICVMFCSFGTRPRVVRLHGHGTVVLPGEPEFDEVVAERDLLRLGAEKRGPDGLRAYRAEHNTSIDGLPGLPLSS